LPGFGFSIEGVEINPTADPAAMTSAAHRTMLQHEKYLLRAGTGNYGSDGPE
jgi:hypothetical protein